MFLSANSLPNGVRIGTTVDQIPEATLGGRYAAVNQNYSTQPATPIDQRPLLVQLVRNTSGAALLPRRGLKFNSVAGDEGKNVVYAGVGDKVVGIVDPYINSAGVPDDDYFLMVIPDPRGTPVTVETDGAVALVVGDTLVPVANGQFTAGAGRTTAGHAEETAVAVAATQFRMAFTAQETSSSTQTVIPNSGGEAASVIRPGVTKVTVGAVTNGVTDYIVLPAFASLEIGDQIVIDCAAGGAFEMRTVAASGTTINGVDSDGTQEYLMTDTEVVTVTKHADGYIATAETALGARGAAVVPD